MKGCWWVYCLHAGRLSWHMWGAYGSEPLWMLWPALALVVGGFALPVLLYLIDDRSARKAGRLMEEMEKRQAARMEARKARRA